MSPAWDSSRSRRALILMDGDEARDMSRMWKGSMMHRDTIEIRGIDFSIEYVRGSWPWVAVCGGCGGRSPKHRTNTDARTWADSHVHTWHEIAASGFAADAKS